jgi:hypothetical protein
MQVSWSKARDVRPIYPSHIRRPVLGYFWTSGVSAPSSSDRRLCASCSSGQGFAYSFFPVDPREPFLRLLFG